MLFLVLFVFFGFWFVATTGYLLAVNAHLWYTTARAQMERGTPLSIRSGVIGLTS
jgi:hypothetical protein